MSLFPTEAESHSNLYLYKYAKHHSESSYNLIQTTVLPSQLDYTHVSKMLLRGTGKDAYLLIGTTTMLYRVPVQTCADLTCQECVASADPFCIYDDSRSVCSAVDGTEESNLAQQFQESSTLCASTTTVETESTTTKEHTDTETGWQTFIAAFIT